MLTGKHTAVGNKVSHSLRRTKRKFYPNLIWRNIKDPVTGMTVRIRLSAKARVDHPSRASMVEW